MKHIKFLLAILFSTLIFGILAGCAGTIGTPFNESKVSEIKEGVTTKKWVIENVGEPAEVTQSPAGETWMYQASKGISYLDMAKYTLGGSMNPGGTKHLILTFDGNIVKKVKTNIGGMSYKESLEKPAKTSAPEPSSEATQQAPAPDVAPITPPVQAVEPVANPPAPAVKKARAVKPKVQKPLPSATASTLM